eukprot:scaffold153552_cov32-Prasinocladus_malaysianus.AAC.3
MDWRDRPMRRRNATPTGHACRPHGCPAPGVNARPNAAKAPCSARYGASTARGRRLRSSAWGQSRRQRNRVRSPPATFAMPPCRAWDVEIARTAPALVMAASAAYFARFAQLARLCL